MTYSTSTLVDIAQQAGDIILAIRQQDIGVEIKDNDSPVTRADKAASEFIIDALSKLEPSLPVLSEEACDIGFDERKTWERYWLIDPLDGTKSFIRNESEYTVNIALIDQHQPILGVIVIPVTGEYYFGGTQTQGAFFGKRNKAPTPIATRPCQTPISVVTSTDHVGWIDPFLNQLPDAHIVRSASSIKLCLLAASKSDIYPRLAPTMEWDIAAGQAILEAANGAVLSLDGMPLRYNTKDDLTNPHFIAVGDPSHPWLHYFKETS